MVVVVVVPFVMVVLALVFVMLLRGGTPGVVTVMMLLVFPVSTHAIISKVQPRTRKILIKTHVRTYDQPTTPIFFAALIV